MKHIFITDPFSLLVPGHDSTLALMREALEKKHQVWQACLHDITFQNNQVMIFAQEMEKKEQITLGNSKEKFSLSKEMVVWMRKDPPVDSPYIRACQLLRLTSAHVVNRPDPLLACDEKLFALEFPELMPETFILQSLSQIKSLIQEKEKLIAKVIGGKGGEGIFLLQRGDKNISSILEMMTSYGKDQIILQEYLPGVRKGDKRIFLLDGEPIGAILRIPLAEDNRANMAAGAGIKKTSLTSVEIQICQKIKPRLLELGMHIVGIDTIDDKLTEINITSPTGLEEIAHLDGSNPAKKIITWSETLA